MNTTVESINPAEISETENDSLSFYVKNYENICKFCCKLKIGENKMKLIFDESTEIALKESLELIERITYTLNNDSLIDDTEYNYINLMCEDCERKINEFFEFKRSCERNSAILYQVRDELDKLNETVEKLEVIDNIPVDKDEILNEDPQLPDEVNQKTKRRKEVNALDGTVCQICGKLVKGIQMHILIHKGIKKFKCQYCQKSFTQSGRH